MNYVRFTLVAVLLIFVLSAIAACPRQEIPAGDQDSQTAPAPAPPTGGQDALAPPPDGADANTPEGDEGKEGTSSAEPDIVVDGTVAALDVAAKKIEVAYVKDGKARTQICMLDDGYDKCVNCGMSEEVAKGIKGKFVLRPGASGVLHFVGITCDEKQMDKCADCKEKKEDKGGATT